MWIRSPSVVVFTSIAQHKIANSFKYERSYTFTLFQTNIIFQRNDDTSIVCLFSLFWGGVKAGSDMSMSKYRLNEIFRWTNPSTQLFRVVPCDLLIIRFNFNQVYDRAAECSCWHWCWLLLLDCCAHAALLKSLLWSPRIHPPWLVGQKGFGCFTVSTGLGLLLRLNC